MLVKSVYLAQAAYSACSRSREVEDHIFSLSYLVVTTVSVKFLYLSVIYESAVQSWQAKSTNLLSRQVVHLGPGFFQIPSQIVEMNQTFSHHVLGLPIFWSRRSQHFERQEPNLGGYRCTYL